MSFLLKPADTWVLVLAHPRDSDGVKDRGTEAQAGGLCPRGAGGPGSAPQKGWCPVGGRGPQPSSHCVTHGPVAEEKLSADPQGQRGATPAGPSSGAALGPQATVPSTDVAAAGTWVSHAVPAREQPREGWAHDPWGPLTTTQMPQAPSGMRAVMAAVISSLAVKFGKIISEHREVAWLLMRSPGLPPPSCCPPLGWEPPRGTPPGSPLPRPCCSPLRMDVSDESKSRPEGGET